MSESSSPSMIRDLTKGPVAAQLLRFAMPLFLSNALQAVYNLVDMIVVGNYIGKTGLSAVSIGGDILHLLTFVAMGFSSAGQVIIARSVGAGLYDEVRKTIGTMFSFLLSTSLVIAAVCYGLRYSVLDWLNTPAASAEYTMDYMVIMQEIPSAIFVTAGELIIMPSKMRFSLLTGLRAKPVSVL